MTREELYHLVWEQPLTKLSKELGTPYSGLIKTCKDYNIPTPEIGYWQKIQFGKSVKKPPLPISQEADSIIELPKLKDEIKTPASSIEALNLKMPNTHLILKAGELRNPDKITLIARKAIEDRQKDEWGKRQSTVTVFANSPRIDVSKSLISRTLTVLDVLIKNFRTIGYSVSVEDRGMFIYSDDEKMEIYIKERNSATQTLSSGGYSSRVLQPTGKLVVKVQYLWRIFEFADDKKRQVEDKIADILLKIGDEFARHKEDLRLWKIEREKREALQKIEDDKKKRKEEEINRFIAFYEDASRWKKLMIMQEYYTFLQAGNLKSVEELQWIKDKLDWYDPSVNKSDELLDGVEKNKLKI